MYRITLLLAVLLMVPTADVFGQCGGGFFGRRASYGGCGSSYSFYSGCGNFSSYDGCGVSYGGCGVVADDGCGSCEPTSNTSEPMKAIQDEKVDENANPAPAPKPAAPKHPTEVTSVSFQSTASKGVRTIRNTKKPGSGYIVLENVSPTAKVIINDHLTAKTGTRRAYESPNLSPGKYYSYRIVIQHGHGIQEVWQVVLMAGDAKVVKVN